MQRKHYIASIYQSPMVRERVKRMKMEIKENPSVNNGKFHGSVMMYTEQKHRIHSSSMLSTLNVLE